MTSYYIAETAVGAHITNWKPTKARSLAGAKKAAQAGRTFRGTEAHVGQQTQQNGIVRIATRRPATTAHPGWTDADI